MADEPRITINGVELTVAQALTVRVALHSFESDLLREGLGEDYHGGCMTKGYLMAVRDIQLMIHGWPEDHREPHIGVPGPGYDENWRD